MKIIARSYPVTVILIAVLCVVIRQSCAQSNIDQMPNLYFPSFRTNDQNKINHEVDEAIKERANRIRQLINIVDDKDSASGIYGPLHSAVILLGTYRAKEAIDSLAKRLSYLPEISNKGITASGDYGPRESYYPCAAALVEIGEPSNVVRVMLNKIAMSNQKLDRELAAWVIQAIKGKDQAIRFIEKDAAKTSSQGRVRLLGASEFLLHYTPRMGDDPRLNLYQRKPVPTRTR